MFEQAFRNIDDVLRREAGWGVVEASRIRRELIAPVRIEGGGKRGMLHQAFAGVL